MKYGLMFVFLVMSAVVYSQDTLKQGNTSGRGNQGDGDSYSIGRGAIIDTLDNRKLLYKGVIKDSCVEKGRVVLTVEVDRKGNVVSAIIGRGSTPTSTCLQEAAKAAALLSKFEKNENAAALQSGRMVFYFRRK